MSCFAAEALTLSTRCRHPQRSTDEPSSFPAAIFNGADLFQLGCPRRNNDDRHLNRWTGFQNWWRSFFGVRMTDASESASRPLLLRTPRAGNRTIDVMVNDFLTAWLIEGDVIAAMGYIFKTRAGDAPVLRLLWRNEAGTWRITAYGVELP